VDYETDEEEERGMNEVDGPESRWCFSSEVKVVVSNLRHSFVVWCIVHAERAMSITY
jgi:hypothetical protein